MIEAKLTRLLETGGATRGKLVIEGAGIFHTLELPWKDNKASVSCIPAGRYKVEPHGWEQGSKLHFKEVWQLSGVPNRTGVLIHSGNTTADIEGCILIGHDAGFLNHKPAVLSSRAAIDLLRRKIGNKSWYLTIEQSTGGNHA